MATLEKQVRVRFKNGDKFSLIMSGSFPKKFDALKENEQFLKLENVDGGLFFINLDEVTYISSVNLDENGAIDFERAFNLPLC